MRLNNLNPDQTAVALDIVKARGKTVGPHYCIARMGESLVPTTVSVVAQARQMGIDVQPEMIAAHLVDKRRHRQVVFTSKGRFWLPNAAVFLFPTARDEVVFKKVFG